MDTRADRLSRAVRDHPLVIEARVAHRCEGGSHSYLGDGRVVCWVVPSVPVPARAGLSGGDAASGNREDVGVTDPPLAHAVDAELAAQTVPSSVESRWRAAGPADAGRFWDQWCATEVLALLADVPMVVLVRRGAVTSSPGHWGQLEVHWLVRRLGDVVVAHGLAWTNTTPRGQLEVT